MVRLQLILACLQVCLPGEPGLAAIGIRVRDNGDTPKWTGCKNTRILHGEVPEDGLPAWA